jgi:hypothetical protein
MSRWSLVRLLPLVTTILAFLPGGATPQSAADLRRGFHHITLLRAREGAARRLERPECERVLAEFRDGQGRTLAESLAPWNMSASQYVRELAFRDGSFHPLCREGRSLLVAGVGKPPVFVCAGFSRKAERDPWIAEIWVIHEALHTLGLGENPPSSREITERVSQACGG